jgi:dolichol-phosphate mannosyltransferase
MQDESLAASRSSSLEEDRATPPPASLSESARVHTRVRHGMRRPHNWLQLVKFCVVGGSGYVVNLCVFTLAVEVFGAHHLLGASIAFVVAVTNNFWWNRHWTFGAREGHAGFQAARFFTVSIGAFLFAAGVLEVLVSVAEMPEVAAQAISIVAATPLNFVGNKMWSFDRRLRRG